MTMPLPLRAALLLALIAIPSRAVEPAGPGGPDLEDAAPLGLRLNQIQVIGTHNSYHLEPYEGIMAVKYREILHRPVAGVSNATERYQHDPLPDQLEQQHVRQLELDLYADPKGGLYQNPLGFRLARLRHVLVPDDGRFAAMAAPGIKIMHTPDFDFHTSVLTLHAALAEVRAWSKAHPRHIPIFFNLELKGTPAPINPNSIGDPVVQGLVDHAAKPVPWDEAQFAVLEREILAVFPRDEIITPDEVRGSFATLRDAVRTRGWPTLDACRGRVLFWLDNGGAVRDRYLGPAADLRGRLIFACVAADQPAAGVMECNDPERDFTRIQALVRAGFIVRTRADAELREARARTTTRRDCALASGAQCVSTDFPVPDRRYSDYEVRLPGGASARLNPVNTAPTPAAAFATPN